MTRPVRFQPTATAPAVSASTNISRAAIQMRMVCPDCEAGIDLSLPSLLMGKPVWCAGCGAKLEIDRDASAAALDRLNRGLEKLEQVRAGAGAGPRSGRR